MRGNLLEVQLLGLDAFLVDAGAVTGLGIVGVRFGQTREKCGLERRGLLAENLHRQLQYARRVGDHLHGLDAGNVVEEPSATGEHQLRVALHLHQLKGAHAFVFAERVRLLRGQEAID